MIFDPILILYQIVTLQCFYYFAYGSLLIICHTVLDFNISLDYYFTPKYVNFTSLVGWIQTICILMSSLAGWVPLCLSPSLTLLQLQHELINTPFPIHSLSRAYLLSIIVEKSKKCVDFTFTLYFIHITVCCLYYQVLIDWLHCVCRKEGSKEGRKEGYLDDGCRIDDLACRSDDK